jgi:hypothetical protein
MKSLLGKLGVILIIGLFIFGYICPVADIANAQSAWIVWRYNSSWPPLSEWGVSDWAMGKAFPTYSKCMDEVKTKIMALKIGHRENDLPELGLISKITGYGEDWISFKYFKKDDGSFVGTVTTSYYCYPETIDPRKK